jgi:YD repeat-containing protein
MIGKIPAVIRPAIAVLAVGCGVLAAVPGPAWANSRENADLGWSNGTADFAIHRWPDPVNVKNANFYLPNTDIEYPAAGFPLEIERSYNSRSLNDGPLGFGWSFNYDIYVQIGDDGLPEVVDADGFICKFLPQGGGSKNAQEASIDQYLAAKKDLDTKSGISHPPDYYVTLKQRMLNDPKLFDQLKKDLPNVQIDPPEGVYISTTRGVQQLEIRKEGYKRTFNNGITHIFYKSGKLRQMIDPTGHTLSMKYSKGATGDLVEVAHSTGARLTFEVSPAGKITRATDPEGHAVQYRYDANHNLTGYKDTTGKVTSYEYDEWHNMTKITFPNADVIMNKYQTEKDWILAQKGPGDHITTYEYGTDPADDTHYWTVVDEDAVKTRYDYYDAQNRVVTTDPQGNKVDRTFSECCGKPLKVVESDGRIVNYEYDKRGNTTRIWDNRGQNMRYEYDPKWNKVTKVLTPSATTVFSYDGSGNLVLGKDSTGGEVHLSYTPEARVQSVDNGKGEAFDFRYNAAGKPVMIAPRGGKGAVVIDYGPDGNVVAVKTTGTVDQRQVLGDLQKLIQIVEPAYKFEL